MFNILSKLRTAKRTSAPTRRNNKPDDYKQLRHEARLVAQKVYKGRKFFMTAECCRHIIARTIKDA